MISALFGGGEKYKNHFENGVYTCKKCSEPLFSSAAKYKHNSPWPAFSEAINVSRKHSDGGSAYKVMCGKCKQPLGHEFVGNGPQGKSRW